ncbi:hypothetical protein RXV86_06650 [Alisedimentitalea sp. MJ-SS2]|uniref:hypothetical protein n=1 Tax=Aliisedimentitalea sp. MJ-SS2 TaxID=3049795 RepID=UPI0029158EEB|nr:hypothetical protein [Alisedimentitalea sp. MJ-SS2]MDU8927057.1 hypothetical protein [Alisedimentitalea sp. MJ-SS2]
MPLVMLPLAFAGLHAMQSSAQAAEFGDMTACLKAQIEAGQPIVQCVTELQSICLSYDAPSMAGADCYRRAKDHWGGLIAAKMDQITTSASEEVAAIAGIEVKYDLKGNLMQCDRMEELALVQKTPGEETVYTRLRCEATAVGMAYAKLFFQSSGLK